MLDLLEGTATAICEMFRLAGLGVAAVYDALFSRDFWAEAMRRIRVETSKKS